MGGALTIVVPVVFDVEDEATIALTLLVLAGDVDEVTMLTGIVDITVALFFSASSIITGETFLKVTCFCSVSARRIIACIATFWRGFRADDGIQLFSELMTRSPMSRLRSSDP